MIMHICFWYVVVSYIVGFGLFGLDIVVTLLKRSRAIKAQKHTEMDLSRSTNIGSALIVDGLAMLLSPLTAWHILLHYVATVWYKYQGKPVRYWI